MGTRPEAPRRAPPRAGAAGLPAGAWPRPSCGAVRVCPCPSLLSSSQGPPGRCPCGARRSGAGWNGRGTRCGGQRLPRCQGEGGGFIHHQHGVPRDLHSCALFCTLQVFSLSPPQDLLIFFCGYVATLTLIPRNVGGNRFKFFGHTLLFVVLVQRPVLKVRYMTKTLVENVCVCLLLCMSQDLCFCKTPLSSGEIKYSSVPFTRIWRICFPILLKS